MMYDPKIIAEQLSCPSGTLGVEIGNRMNTSNGELIRNTLGALRVKAGDKVLEIGYGNGNHISELFEQYLDFQYFGLDISALMHEEARQRNVQYINTGKASFQLYNGHDIPMVDNYFDTVFSINTIYFWEDSQAFLKEIIRVLKTNGRLVLAYVDRNSMEHLPFEECGFELYDLSKLKKLFQAFPLTIHSVEKYEEQISSSTGKSVARECLIVGAIYKTN